MDANPMDTSLSARPGKSVLVIEDEPLMRQVLFEELELAGYAVRQAANGAEALPMIHENGYDLILCDVNMPKMNGLQLLRRIRAANGRFARTPFLFLSALGQNSDIVHGLELGADDYITKPVDFDILIAKIEAVLRSREGLNNHYQEQMSDLRVRFSDAREQINHLVNFDTQTGLPNKQHFCTCLQQILKSIRELDAAGNGVERAVRLFTVRLVNDDGIRSDLDRQQRESFLNILKTRIEEFLLAEGLDEAQTLLGRDGESNTFQTMVPVFTSAFDDVAFAGRMAEYLCARVNFEGGITVNPMVHIGSVQCPEDGKNAGELMQKAEFSALYGGRSYNPYSPRLKEAYQRENFLKSRLVSAIRDREFYLSYQPKIDVESGIIVGAEALIRWRMPDGEVVQPGEFIPLAESPEFMFPITEWVIDESCRQLSEWQDQGITVAINIPPNCLNHEDFHSILNHYINCHGVNPYQMELELLETSTLGDTRVVQQNLDRIHEAGVRLAIDDFGTGYSAFDYMAKHQFDTLKIDRSLILGSETDPQKQKIIDSMIYLAHGLGLKAVAEGVESRQVLELLRGLNCDSYQGFLRYRPMRSAEFSDLIL